MLRSTHVALRPLLGQDQDRLFEWISDRELVIRNAPYRPVSEAHHRAWFGSIANCDDAIAFAIILNQNEELIGVCQLRDIHWIHRNAYLQIRIGSESARGKGYGTEAIRLLLKHAFHDLNLNRVSLEVFTDNTLAIRAYEKAGFVTEGTRRKGAFIDRQYVDVLLMGVLREEYGESPGSGSPPA